MAEATEASESSTSAKLAAEKEAHISDDLTFERLVGNGGIGYNYSYYYYHSSIPY